MQTLFCVVVVFRIATLCSAEECPSVTKCIGHLHFAAVKRGSSVFVF